MSLPLLSVYQQQQQQRQQPQHGYIQAYNYMPHSPSASGTGPGGLQQQIPPQSYAYALLNGAYGKFIEKKFFQKTKN